MRRMHDRRLPLAVLGTVLLLAGCASTGSEPTSGPFDAPATSASFAAVDRTLESPQYRAFEAASSGIDAALGGAVTTASTTALLSAVPAGGRALPAPSGRASALVASLATAGTAPAGNGVPAGLLGAVFVWNADTQRYERAPGETGNAQAVRFRLYALDPVTKRPSLPLTAVGHADVRGSFSLALGAGAAGSFSVTGWSNALNAEFLNYTVTLAGTGTTGGGTLTYTVQGFLTDGGERMEFTLRNALATATSGTTATIDWSLAVPTEGNFRYDVDAVFRAATLGGPVDGTLTAVSSGGGGGARLTGTMQGTRIVLTATVGGREFARITVDESTGTTTITDPSGAPLSSAETQALKKLFEGYEELGDLLDKLLKPSGVGD